MQYYWEYKKLHLLYIILFAMILWGSEYVRRNLWEPDEARYAYVANEMKQTGSWMILRRHGEYYAHKPPLMFWLINLSSRLTHGEINNISTRLPSLLGIILSLWTTARLAERWHNRKTAWRSILVLSTIYTFWHEGGMGQIDALLCGLQMTALYFLFTKDENSAESIPRVFIAYIFMGLAILAKGPVGILVPLGVYISSILAAGRKQVLKGTHWLWGPLVSLTFPALWLVGAWLQGAHSEYFNELLFTQNTERLSGELGHPRPFYYFLIYFPLNLMPWTIFLPAAYMAIKKSHNDLMPLQRRLTAWILFVIVFFSIPSCKRGLYILLAYPAASMLIAAAWDNISIKWSKITAYTSIGLLSLLGIAALAASFSKELPISRLIVLPMTFILLAGAFTLYTIFKTNRLSSTWFYCFVGILLVNQLYAANIVFHALNPIKTPVELAQAARTRLEPGQKLLLYQIQGEILTLYCNTSGILLDNPQQLLEQINKQQKGIVVLSQHVYYKLPVEIRVTLAPHTFNMGHKKLTWCEFNTLKHL